MKRSHHGCQHSHDRAVLIAPLAPCWPLCCRRQTPGSLVGACKASLRRLGVDQVALYIQVCGHIAAWIWIDLPLDLQK